MQHLYLWSFMVIGNEGQSVESHVVHVPEYVKTAGEIKQFLIKYLVKENYPSGQYALERSDMIGETSDTLRYVIYFNKR